MNLAASTAACERPVEAFQHQWRRLHDQADELAELAGLAREPRSESFSTFPERLFRSSPDQRALAWQGMDDLDAMLQPGLVALRTITARGQDPSIPSMALWREFFRARELLLRLAASQLDNAA